MPETVAGGPIGLEPEPLQEAQVGDGADSASESEDQETQTRATEDQSFTKAQVEEMIAQATQGMVSREEMELNVGRVRSQYDRARNADRAEWEDRDRQYQQQIHELTIRDMDEDARAKYERQIYARRADELEDRLIQTQAELEAARQIGPYIKNLQEGFGVDVNDLDLSDVNELSRTAFEAAVKAHQKTRQELQEAREQLKSVSKSEPAKGEEKKAEKSTSKAAEAPDVVTQKGSASSAAPTILDLRKSVSQRMGLDKVISEEQLFELAERPDETGVDLNVVLQALAAELEEEA